MPHIASRSALAAFMASKDRQRLAGGTPPK